MSDWAGLWARVSRRWASSSREALEADDEERERSSRGTIPISEVHDRHEVVLSGTLQSVTYSPVDAPARLVATLFDGTGTVELRWEGRRSIPGIDVGRRIEVTGTVGRHRNHLAIIDPLYRLLPVGPR